MTTYLFSQIASGTVLAFDPAVDTLRFDSSSFHAADVRLEYAPGGTSLTLQADGKTLVLQGASAWAPRSGHFSFANSSQILIASPDQPNPVPSLPWTNDLLIGTGVGPTTLTGGDGNDTCVVDSSDDLVVEAAGGGTDKVKSSISYTLGAHVEQLELTGSAHLNGTGNALDNKLWGNAGNNVLDGGAGNDMLDGGAGNDTYVVDSLYDQVRDSGGLDTIRASISYSLISSGIENLVLTGTTGLQGTGNQFSNRLTGSRGNDTLSGLEGQDNLSGGDGNDSLVGGSGNDILGGGTGNDTLFGGDNDDKLYGGAGDDSLSGGAGINELWGGEGHDVLQAGSGSDKLYGGAGNDTLTGLQLFGGGGNDTLIDDSGSPTALHDGGAGDDIYRFSNSSSRATEAVDGGIDTVHLSLNQSWRWGFTYTLDANVENLMITGSYPSSPFDLRGNELDNQMTGEKGDDRLDGGLGADTLRGGSGQDTYVVDNLGDVVIEEGPAGEGDTVESSVSFTLGANLERLILTGSADIDGKGNELNNRLYGNEGVNLLEGGAGNDTLRSSAGPDTLVGGSGDDVYAGDLRSVSIVEVAGGGIDTVESYTDHVLGAQIENLRLVYHDGFGIAALNGTGNGLANRITGNALDNTLQGLGGNDSLEGGEGKDFLDGGAGADSLVGGSGNDLYRVDSTDDIVVEEAGGGIDSVHSAISHTLGSQVENLTLTGSSAIDATGNELANALRGNSSTNRLAGGLGQDTLDGGYGRDTLEGGEGRDSFVVRYDGSANADLITDFSCEIDKLCIAWAAGDGDRWVEGATLASGPGGFAAGAELVIITTDIVGSITAQSAAQAIGAASSAYAAGQTAVFVVDNGSDSAVYLFTASSEVYGGAGAAVSSSELQLLATLQGTASTALGDYLFAA